MIFQFEGLLDFLTMSGHGSYVWASYAVTLLALMFLIIIPIHQKKQLAIQIKRQQRIESSVINERKILGSRHASGS
ncbi:MAG: heme exporter protein D [Cellvibrionaceae bacterium]|jgi:heme exporter protein D